MVLTFVVLMTLLPWAMRNKQVLGRTVITSTAGPFNFYGWGIARTIEERLGGVARILVVSPTLGEIESMDAYRAATKEFYAHPPVIKIFKAIIFNLIELYYPFLPAYDGTFGVLPAFWDLGLMAFLGSPERRPLLLLILYASAVYCFAGVMISRHRQILAPAFILLSIPALQDFSKRLGRRRFTMSLSVWLALQCLIWAQGSQLRNAALLIRNSYSHSR